VGRHRPPGSRMTALGVILVVAVLLAVYLLAALLRPERF
jgi:K+-transporting ATPase KdpF subunit